MQGSLAASNLGVSPLLLNLGPQTPSGQLELANSGDSADRLQTRMFKWTRNQCVDRMEPTQSLIASPPILGIAAGGKQVVRVLLRDSQPSSVEGTYRITLTEIGEVAPQPGTVTTRLNISLPIFVKPAGRTITRLQWSVVREGPLARLSVSNAGNVHDRLRSIRVLDSNGNEVAKESRGDYLLAGDSCSWPVPAGRSVVVTTESGETTLHIPAL